jgi:hypothetical protein
MPPGQAFYDHIEGSHYEPGFQYVLRVAERHVQNPPADGSSLAYRLIAILAKVAVPTANPRGRASALARGCLAPGLRVTSARWGARRNR